MTTPDPLQKALELPNGARFYRCALQVNPFEYLNVHSKKTSFQDEDSYNRAIVQACLSLGIQVIAVTDHFKIKTSVSLIEAARKAGIHAFPGFEAVSKDGVHLLCLFEADRSLDEIERIIGACGIHNSKHPSPAGDHDVQEMLQRAHGWDCICIAAHVVGAGGLLRRLQSQARVNAWTSPDLLACALAGPIDDAPEDLRPILQNKNPDYERSRRVAVINAQDVNSPEDLEKPGASSWIKMSGASIEGLRQAILDPESRIRLGSDKKPNERLALTAMAWEGGFLDGQAIHFSENLNVLIGGRGVGKSTVIESLRYVLNLEPLGPEAHLNHEGIVREVLRSGTRITLLVTTIHPTKQTYQIERIVPNPPVVRDGRGQVLPFHPGDILPLVEIYGQHEISELTRSREKLTRLLERFIDRDPDLEPRKVEIRKELGRTRSQLLHIREEMQGIDDKLSRLPSLEETLRQYQASGLEERLKEQSLIVREERVLRTADERAAPFQEILARLRREIPLDRAFLSEQALADLPGQKLLAHADTVLANLEREAKETADQLSRVIDRARQGLASVKESWKERQTSVQKEYERILRELQRSSVDGEEFIRLRRQIEDLRPLRERSALLLRDREAIENLRRNLLAEWEEVKSDQFRRIERAARNVNRKLLQHVKVTVTSGGDIEPLMALLRDQVGGRLAETLEVLRRRTSVSVRELADLLRTGSMATQNTLGIPLSQADRLCTNPELALQLEELELPPTTLIELNIAPEGQQPVWQKLEDLSTGQKATAVLLLLLLESEAPLIVDQPEDDLDNRFITEVIVQKMREEKQRRQFVFSSHNANIPVLGDAELILGLQASGEAGQGSAELPVHLMGSIDTRPVRELVEEILEGGQRAFELRRLKYGF
jgi:hypothetical protein